ncbi:MAG: fibrobacter succinogenes major paralogous domain-containing protein [Cyclobacteriaceae bacterium]|nr:fibrobacter succinogenes major paralogous domain-containing protein [Cyclobacteriaceae bacterium]
MKSLLYLSIILSLLALSLLSSCKDEEDVSEVKDIDENLYHTVKIGSQTWMVENLKTTKYNDGTPIPNILDSWNQLMSGAYCNYDNILSNAEGNGRLYNFYAVNSGKLCPKGWHVPSDDEWTSLIEYLGGKYEAASKLKEAGASHWLPPFADGTNETGFTALPSGWKSGPTSFHDLGVGTAWWSSTIGSSSDEAYTRQLYLSIHGINRNYTYHLYGMSVRCIKD